MPGGIVVILQKSIFPAQEPRVVATRLDAAVLEAVVAAWTAANLSPADPMELLLSDTMADQVGGRRH